MNNLATELRQLIIQRVEHAQDGEIATIVNALCYRDMPAAPAPSISFELQDRFALTGDMDHADYGGMVVDQSTGLTWSRGNVPGGRMNWAKAKEACTALRLGGFTDWRLPTIQELLTLIDYERHEPAINTDFFQCESSWYWTSTPAHSSPGGYAWIVHFSGGYSSWASQDGDGCVRAVRSSQ